MCMDLCGGDEIILLFRRGLVFESIFFGMIPQKYIQQSTIEIEDVIVSIRGDVIAMKSLNGEGNTSVCE